MDERHGKPVIAKIGQTEFESEVLQSKEPVLVAFGADWSRPCHVVESALGEVAALVAAGEVRLKVVRVDADDNPELSLWYDVQSIPTFLFFEAGRLAGRLVGTASREAILTKLAAVERGGGGVRGPDRGKGGGSSPGNGRNDQREPGVMSPRL